MNLNLFFAGFLGISLLLGSIPLSISDPEIPPFANPNAVSHMSSTAIDVLDNLPEHQSEGERKKKFDDGFYDKISDLKTSRGDIEICPSELIKNTSKKIIDPTGCISVLQLDSKQDYYDVIILVKKVEENGVDRKTMAKYNKNYLENVLQNIHGVTEYYKAKELSFITASVPLSEISKITDYNFVKRIGDGQNEIKLELNDSKETINSLNLSVIGDGVLVGIIDSGIRQNHNDLPVGTTIVDQMVCDNSNCPTTSQVFSDDDNHGTHVAGIVAGIGDIDSDLKGVAPGSTLLNVKFTGSSTGLGIALDETVSRGADIINLSMGFSSCKEDVTNDILDEVWDVGVIVVKSAGGDGNGSHTITNPGCGYNVLAVGNLDDNDTGHILTDDFIDPFSSRGPTNVTSTDPGRIKPEIVAPGTSIDSPDNVSNYDEKSGTSYAAPHVSGAAALILDQNSYLKAIEVKLALLTGATWPLSSANTITADNYEISGFTRDTLNDYGFGVLNVTKSLELTSSGKNILVENIKDDFPISMSYTFTADEDDITKVILHWFHRPNGPIPAPIAQTVANYTMTIFNPDDTIFKTSESANQNYEFVMFTAPVDGTYTIQVESELPVVKVGGFQNYALASTHELSTLDCPDVPVSGNWVITSTCILESNTTPPGNVIVDDISDLLVPDGIELNIDFENDSLQVKEGSRVVIMDGGRIT